MYSLLIFVGGILTVPLLVGENPERIRIAWAVSSAPALMLFGCNVAFVLLICFALRFLSGFLVLTFCSVLCYRTLPNSHRLTLASILRFTISDTPCLPQAIPIYFLFDGIIIRNNKQANGRDNHSHT